MADQQKDVALPIITAGELLLQKLILLSGERACQSLRTVRDVFATGEASKMGKVFGPGQFGEQRAQLLESVHLGVSGAEIAEEVTHDPTVVTTAFRAQRRAERID